MVILLEKLMLALKAMKTWVERQLREVSGKVNMVQSDLTVVQSDLTVVQSDLTVVQSDLNDKMNREHPVCTGSFSMNRRTDSIIGKASHAEGSDTTASGNFSHSEGYHTMASGVSSHAEGNGSKSSGDYSHAEGSNTISSGDNSHAEGIFTVASGKSSHAEGEYIYDNDELKYTTASGIASHAEGSGTTASGNSSHAEGFNTTASGDYSHVQGKFNIEDINNKYAHIVGNGISSKDEYRANAHTLDWNGNAWYQGDVYVGSTSGVNRDEGSKKLATEEYVDAHIENKSNPHEVTAAQVGITSETWTFTLDDGTTVTKKVAIMS